MNTKKSASPNITDHMILIGLCLTFVYWFCESFLNLFLSNPVSLTELIFGQNIDKMWHRIIVLCLFVIFGSHAQFTIDTRKKAEKALIESEERYRTLVENLPIGILRHGLSAEADCIMINPYFLKMFDFESLADLQKIKMKDLFKFSSDYNRYISQLTLQKSILWNEIQLKQKGGTVVWASVSARVVRDEKIDDTYYVDCTFENITEKKAAALETQKAEETRRKFQRLLSPDLAELVVSGELNVEKGGESRVATVLFADIRGFTSLSENTEATEVLQMLNEYFELMVEIVFRYEGTVDKFIGDAIMVIWGAPITHADDPVRAIQSAIDMRHMLDEFNRRRYSLGKQPIQIGIGINTGKLVAGYIGSSQTMSYSVIGDTVNTASRLCAVAKSGEIIISETTYRLSEKHFIVTRLKPIYLKGKMKPIQIYSVLDPGLHG